MAVVYVRCAECACIYNSDQDECPMCGSKQIINEDKNEPAEPVFNILD